MHTIPQQFFARKQHVRDYIEALCTRINNVHDMVVEIYVYFHMKKVICQNL